MDTHVLIPGPDLTPNCDFSRRTVFMDTVGSGKWRKETKRECVDQMKGGVSRVL